MKTQDQIQQAHDKLIAAVLEDPELGFSDEQREIMAQLCKVLCWVLEDNDEHVTSFEDLLKDIDEAAKARGFKLHCPSRN